MDRALWDRPRTRLTRRTRNVCGHAAGHTERVRNKATGTAQPRRPSYPLVSSWQVAAVWLLGLAVFLPGALNRFVFLKLAFGAAALITLMSWSLDPPWRHRSLQPG